MTRGARRTEGAAERSPGLWAARAGVAERAIRGRHLRRLWGLPGTRLGVVRRPARLADRLFARWHYWWQAHLLDCLIDAHERAPAAERVEVIGRLIRGVHLRNLRHWTNDYYDDIAWLGLALHRARDLVDTRPALAEITARLRDGWTEHGGGGIWWRRGDTFKNVPANGPAAILLARARVERADRQRARAMAEWMERSLRDPGTGLMWDGLHVAEDGGVRDVVTTTYTYCQGVYLGACVELAGHEPAGPWVGRAARTVRAVEAGLAPDGVLRGHDGGDGGLFTGILTRYLADAAIRLPAAEGETAARLVTASAEALWDNRGALPGGPLFGPEFARPADLAGGPEHDLSVQLSGWMALEAAARLEGRASMAG
ncbi:glycoside hydrolase family 76 protein [Actinokineospora sp. UTMC 2448]|uniref:glycoside hydrolase family 76 protein n=1 Tax=Actinokineospora sp. UTMC 2448 TaxID=2268449 RepID=UPI002164EA54|nr:glycoside hydrolase family 76 protein [Actinokineospora sp. UTMC 2448]